MGVRGSRMACRIVKDDSELLELCEHSTVIVAEFVHITLTYSIGCDTSSGSYLRIWRAVGSVDGVYIRFSRRRR